MHPLQAAFPLMAPESLEKGNKPAAVPLMAPENKQQPELCGTNGVLADEGGENVIFQQLPLYGRNNAELMD